ncbi:DUF7344 domain-containing protein [Haladaptatus halobius]|uniref:DUF7344 domain-containing protein n=1 Tax=Haladaptatus halobius TaxID=2884875 RepID=UPI003F625CED
MTRITDDTPTDIFILLERAYCRETLCYLLQQDRTVPLTEVARHITQQEADTQHETISPTVYENIYASLEREHIPRLVEAGLVTQTRRCDHLLISLTSNIQYVEPSLRPYAPTPNRYRID